MFRIHFKELQRFIEYKSEQQRQQLHTFHILEMIMIKLVKEKGSVRETHTTYCIHHEKAHDMMNSALIRNVHVGLILPDVHSTPSI